MSPHNPVHISIVQLEAPPLIDDHRLPTDNISPYSTGNTGASLTSTSVAPVTASSIALFDEEELMYDEISTVRKEKDRAKKRAYVRMVTNMGGSLNLELFCEKVSRGADSLS
jgi:peptidyl-prolyl cis-trans isomerase-like protein 2